MMKKLMLATIASLFFVGATEAAPKEVLNFTFSMSDDVVGGGSGPEPVRGNHSPVWFGGIYTLQAFFLSDIYGGKDALLCFSSFGPAGSTGDANIQLTKTKDGEARARLWFWGETIDGDAIKYMLTLVDPQGWNGSIYTDFPPRAPEGGPPVLVTMTATEWAMETEGKGKLKNVSCRGSGGVGSSRAEVTIDLSQP